MKHWKTILKVILLVALAAAGGVGYFFAMAWRQSAGPFETTLQWQADAAKLGVPAKLAVDVKLPWHLRPASSHAVRVPAGWVPREDGAWQQGALELSGFRHWSLESSLVPVVATPEANGAISWPLRVLSGPPPRPLQAVLPAVSVNVPTELAKTPRTSTKSLVFQPAVAVAAEPLPAASPVRAWIWVAGLAVVVALAWFIRRFLLRPAVVLPPWTRALDHLTRLAAEPMGEAQAYCTRLSDILKEYASHRFESNLMGASSTEFLRELAQRHPLAEEDKHSLKATLGHADLVRFARAELAKESADAALEHARRFVINTTPTPESDRA